MSSLSGLSYQLLKNSFDKYSIQQTPPPPNRLAAVIDNLLSRSASLVLELVSVILLSPVRSSSSSSKQHIADHRYECCVNKLSELTNGGGREVTIDSILFLLTRFSSSYCLFPL